MSAEEELREAIALLNQETGYMHSYHVRSIKTVLAALEKAQADSARIDWLSKCGTPETFEDAPHSTVWHIIGNLGQRDLRAAIDAAMKNPT